MCPTTCPPRRRPAAARVWRRFSHAQRLARFAVYLVIVAAIVQSARSVEVIPEFLADAPEQLLDLVTRMWLPDWGSLSRHDPRRRLMETIHIATLGTLLALIMALPVGILAAHNLVPSTPADLFAKLILVSSRSVNLAGVGALCSSGSLVLGALAGTLAIAFRSIGFVEAKLFGEALEETQRGPIEALTAAGAPWASRLTFGYWPQVKPAFWSIALFRWDINVRESAVLWIGRRRRDRHGARLGHEPVSVGPRGRGAPLDLCGGRRGRDRGHADAQSRNLM